MNKNFAHDVSATTLENAMLALGQNANVNVNSGVYKMNDVTNMTKAGQWNIQSPTFDRETAITTTSNQPNMASSIIRSGRMIINGNFAGMYDFAYYNGNLDLNNLDFSGSKFDAQFFSGNQDTHWALIYINGDLELDFPNIIRPPVRKLGMCIYVTGDFIANGFVSMTNRGANHSGTGTSHGYTAPVAIPLNGTLTIPAAGGAGGVRAASGTGSQGSGDHHALNNGTAAGGSSTATYCGSGGGGSGSAKVAVNGNAVKGGSGTDGTCFTGGGSGAGLMVYNGDNSTQGWDADNRYDAVPNGGCGGQAQNTPPQNYGNSEGIGNPGGYAWRLTSYDIWGREYGEAKSDNSIQAAGSQARPPNRVDGSDGLAGTCITMVAGTYSGSGKFRSTGKHAAHYHDGNVGGTGGGGAGGINIVLYGTDSSGPTPTCAGGSGGNYYAGGTGGAGTGLKAAL